MSENIGKIVQVIGAVVDVAFPDGHLPKIIPDRSGNQKTPTIAMRLI